MSLSLPVQLPILPADTRSPQFRPPPPTYDAHSPVSEPLTSSTGPQDKDFLTAIAAQERRVLELKEELQKAEVSLNSLKRQWAMHEASKKRDDARRLTKLQPLPTSTPTTAQSQDDADGSNAWMMQEMERRKAIMSSGKSSSRTVFSGSRHTRTLSLLSPTHGRDGSTGLPSRQIHHPPRKESLSNPCMDDLISQVPAPLPRLSTTPDLTHRIMETTDSAQLREQAVSPEVLLNTGKQMATTFKDGFWSFVEDLRQATVGDEATQQVAGQHSHLRQQSSSHQVTPRTARKQTSRASLRPSSIVSTGSKGSTDTKRPAPSRQQTAVKGQSKFPDLADASFWTEFGGHTTPATAKKTAHERKTTTKASPRPLSIASSEAWDNWEDSSPQVSRSSSATSESATVPSTVSGATSPRVSTDRSSSSETPSKRDSIPWPALNKFGPATLRRTASHLMNEWEKSLTPSPGQGWSGQEDYLGLSATSAEAAAFNPR